MSQLSSSVKASLVRMAHSTISVMNHDDRAKLSNCVKCEYGAHGVLGSASGVANDCAFGKVETKKLLGNDAGIAARDWWLSVSNHRIRMDEGLTDRCCRFPHLFGFHDALLEEGRRLVRVGVFSGVVLDAM